MARLDPVIDRLLKEHGDALLIETGQPIRLRAPGGESPIIRSQLTFAQVVAALIELLPASARLGFPHPGHSAYAYLAPGGQVTVTVESFGSSIRATISPGARLTRFNATPLPAAPPAPEPPPPPARPTSAPLGPVELAERARASSWALLTDPAERMAALLNQMVERRASDLHLTSGCPPMFRVDGDIVPAKELTDLTSDSLRSMLWTIAPAKNRAEWDERKDTDFAHETENARFRVNVFADRRGIGAVLRQIPTQIRSAEEMGLSTAITDLCLLTKGLVLVTGPTGSGKSTTLAAMVDFINRNREDHILTIEDPIEFVHPNKRCLVNQREVGVHTHSFKQALRAALREDPDVVLVGELRDLETISIAIETAETGHLVFGTLHTNTAPSTVDRIIDQFPADRQPQVRMMLSESLKGVVSQTLCKKIGGGRVAAQEILLVNGSVSNLIREGKTFQIPSVMQTGRALGMNTLNDALLDLVKKGEVAPADAIAKSMAKAELKAAIERSGQQADAARAA